MNAFVGRQRELQTLRTAMDAAVHGNGSLVLVSGEAGIGKTALVRELVAEAHRSEILVLSGACYDLSTTPPYGPWTELIGRYLSLDILPPPPAFLRDPDTMDANGSQAALFAQVMGFLAKIADERPLVVVLEDLHWADPASLDLLRYLARQLDGQRILIIATYRDDEVIRQHALFTLLPLIVRESPTIRIELGVLTSDDVRSLLGKWWPLTSRAENQLVDRLLTYAEGHPLFTVEILRTLEHEQVLHRTADGWQLADLGRMPIPRLLQQVIERRVLLLNDNARQYVQIAAVIGHRVPLDVWQAVAKMTDAELLAVLEEAVLARLLDTTEDGNQVSFVHALTREVLYSGTLPPRRREWHRLTAEALARAPRSSPDNVAYHFQQAGDERAAEWLIRAGDRAANSFAALEAIERFEAALSILKERDVDPERQGWLLLKIAVESRSFDSRAALARALQAESIGSAMGNDALASFASFQAGQMLVFLGEGGLGEVERAFRALRGLSQEDLDEIAFHMPTVDTHLQVTTIAITLAIYGHFDRAINVASEALAGPASWQTLRVNDRGHGWAALAHSYCALGQPTKAAEAFDRAHWHYRIVSNDLLKALNDTFEFQYLVSIYYSDEEKKRERKLRDIQASWSRASGASASVPPEFGLLPVMYLDGRWTEARNLGMEHLNQDVILSQFARRAVGVIARHQGDSDIAHSMVNASVPHGAGAEPGEKWFFHTMDFLQLAVGLSLDAGDLGRASEWLEAYERWLAWSGARLWRAGGLLLRAQLHRADGNADSALTCANNALVEASDPRQPLSLIAIHRFLGEIATARHDLENGERHLQQSLTLAQACAVPYERALTMLAQAEMEAGRGNANRARDILIQVSRISTDLGARPTLHRANTLMHSLAPDRSDSHFGISRREMEVLRLLAKGKTDREIAAELYISHHTVMRHVSHILAKLDVDSRTGAVAEALRRSVI